MTDIVQFGFPLTIIICDENMKAEFSVTLNEIKKLFKLQQKLISKGIKFNLNCSLYEAVLQLDKKGFEQLLQDLLS